MSIYAQAAVVDPYLLKLYFLGKFVSQTCFSTFTTASSWKAYWDRMPGYKTELLLLGHQN